MTGYAIFLSGILCDGGLWQTQIEALSDVSNCQYVTPEGETISEMAVSVLNQAPAKFTLFASSMGGYIAFEIAKTAPERLHSLVLTNTSARSDHSKQRELRLSTIEEIKSGQFELVVDRLLPALVSPMHRKDEVLMKHIREMMLRVGPTTTLRQQIATLNRRDARPFLTDISLPTLVISSQHDRVTPPEHGEEITSLVSGAEHHLLNNAGHLSPIEASERITQILRTWVHR